VNCQGAARHEAMDFQLRDKTKNVTAYLYCNVVSAEKSKINIPKGAKIYK
jgi:hypothetical protein